jgi:hypothetical protein
MNTHIVLPRLLASGLGAAGLVSAGCQPATAGALSSEYDGFPHSNTNAQAENETFQITFDSFNNGKITGHIGSVPITGKIDGKFRLTFSGQESSPGLTVKEGKSQFSAAGLFRVGSFKATGLFPGSYTFSVGGGSPLLGPTPPTPTNGFANIGSLTAGYSGHWRHLHDLNKANEGFSLEVTQKKTNGNFTGLLADVPTTGHVDAKGKVTLKGGRRSGANVLKIKNGKAQLSAQGNYLLGSFQITGTGLEASNAGTHLFETVTIV